MFPLSLNPKENCEMTILDFLHCYFFIVAQNRSYLHTFCLQSLLHFYFPFLSKQHVHKWFLSKTIKKDSWTREQQLKLKVKIFEMKKLCISNDYSSRQTASMQVLFYEKNQTIKHFFKVCLFTATRYINHVSLVTLV